MIRWIRAVVQSRIVQDRRSTVAIMVGLAGIPMVLTAGLALDGTRIWLLQTRLQEAVDASVLLAASPGETSVSQTQVTTDTGNLFWADFGRTSRTGNAQTGFINTGFLGATVTDAGFSVTFPDANHVQVTATAPLVLGGAVPRLGQHRQAEPSLVGQHRIWRCELVRSGLARLRRGAAGWL